MNEPESDGAIAEEVRELYSASRSEFVAARNARAAELKADGEADRAAVVKAYPKPSAAADAANRIAREDPEILDRVLALGREFRSAQSNADRPALRELGSRRNRLLRDVAARVASHAPGDRLSGAGADELKQTVLAAIADAAAAEAFRSGRLVRALSSDGLSPVDLSDAVAGPSIPSAPASADGPAAVDTSLERRRAKKELARAEAKATTAEDRARDAESAVDEAEETLQSLRRRLADASERLEAARSERDRARAEKSAATERLSAARAEWDRL
ncbi:hypothetical protein HQQ80_02810 [Microbacteriaceae bacterium VKM Ac-2855]|nr:hypothetical protein [Microbacteriaceae bacterium VKM Ac-2855]